jgi:DNA-binding transcriptional LysR family regulator
MFYGDTLVGGVKAALQCGLSFFGTEGQLVFNSIALRVNAALAGFDLAYLPEGQVQTHLTKGRLIRVRADWCPTFLHQWSL